MCTKKCIHVKRDFFLWRSTNVKRDVHMYKEIYTCTKRCTHVQRDVFLCTTHAIAKRDLRNCKTSKCKTSTKHAIAKRDIFLCTTHAIAKRDFFFLKEIYTCTKRCLFMHYTCKARSTYERWLCVCWWLMVCCSRWWCVAAVDGVLQPLIVCCSTDEWCVAVCCSKFSWCVAVSFHCVLQ